MPFHHSSDIKDGNRTPEQRSAMDRGIKDEAGGGPKLVTFDVFWRRLKGQLAEQRNGPNREAIFSVPKWSEDEGFSGSEFGAVWPGKNVIYCETQKTEDM